MVDATPAQRIIPGAPPPAPVSKSQKKKRKVAKPTEGDATVSIPDAGAAALVEKAPEPEDIKKGAVAEELVATPAPPASETPVEKPKASPMVDLLNKRIKIQSKKLVSDENDCLNFFCVHAMLLKWICVSGYHIVHLSAAVNSLHAPVWRCT